jgi:hypothetical protein
MFDVKDYGAKGDGTSDDSEPIRHALRCLPPGGGEIYFPRGTYLLSKDGSNAWCLDLPDKVMLRGSGRGGTILKLAPKQNKWARILFATSRSGITIRDLTIDGNRLGQTIADCGEGSCEQQHGIFLDVCSGTVIQNVAVHDNMGDSVYLHGNLQANCTDTVISGCLFSGGQRVHIHAHSFTNLAITGCHFFNSHGNNHIKQERKDPGLPASTGASVTGCTFDGDAASEGVEFAGFDSITADITVSGNVFRNLQRAVAIGRHTQGWCIVGNVIENCMMGIQNTSYSDAGGFTANSHMQISGNLIRNLNPQMQDGFPSAETLPIFLSNCTVGSIHGNTVFAPQTFTAIKIAHCDKVSVNGNTIHVHTPGSQNYVMALVIYRCKNCCAVANLIDVPAAQHPVGVWVADDLHVSSDIIVQNNLILGTANPAIMVDGITDPSVVIVVGNLVPSALANVSGPAQPGHPFL